MKKMKFSLLLVFVFSFCIAQENCETRVRGLNIKPLTTGNYSMIDTIPRIVATDDNDSKKPIIVLNDEFVANEILLTIDPNKIESIRIEKGETNVNNRIYNGKIIIKLKSEKQFNFVTLNDLVSKYSNLKESKVIFSLNGEVLNADPDLKIIDEEKILQIKMIKLDKFETNVKLVHFKILSRTPQNVRKANTIYIK